jgi:hypothetical protein
MFFVQRRLLAMDGGIGMLLPRSFVRNLHWQPGEIARIEYVDDEPEAYLVIRRVPTDQGKPKV